MSLVVSQNWDMPELDVKNTFLHAVMEEEVYMINLIKLSMVLSQLHVLRIIDYTMNAIPSVSLHTRLILLLFCTIKICYYIDSHAYMLMTLLSQSL
jgi:hypothetical protein